MFRISQSLRLLGAIALIGALMAFGSRALAQSTPAVQEPVASPFASPAVLPGAAMIDAPIVDASGNQVGSVHVVQNGGGLTFSVFLDAGTLAEGEHGVHVHETGTCSTGGDKVFADAGAHFNPTNQQHGAPNSDTSHAGDLGNLLVAADGSADFTITVTTMTLDPNLPTSLIDADGSALIIHSGADDLKTDPSGNSGDRVLCAVLSTGEKATPEGSPLPSSTELPAASPVATPMG